jgi:hypothetical protein
LSNSEKGVADLTNPTASTTGNIIGMKASVARLAANPAALALNSIAVEATPVY